MPLTPDNPPWQLAVAQHPMYWLIREDAECAERTPPWGAPDIAAYIARLRANLAVLRAHPAFKLGFEWSGLELEQLAEDAPDVLAELLALAAEGRIAFYNGTYAQPHLQTLSAEANYRQFAFGAAVYRQLDARPVTVYAHQETSFNAQTPQLLRAFGYDYAVLPFFPATLLFDEAEVGYHPREGVGFVQGSEFAAWRGLDGSALTLYLRQPHHGSLREWVEAQEVKGLLQAPPLLIEAPDLGAMDEAWLAKREGLALVRLDEALPERERRAPPRASLRMLANWSYIEGIAAEALARANWRAEHSALRAEALDALAWALLGRAPEDGTATWKTILAAQHHDVACFCAPGLKRQAVARLGAAEQAAEAQAERAARAILAQVQPLESGREQIVVFNTTPHAVRAPVSVAVDAARATVQTADGRPLPCAAEPLGAGRARLTFVAESRGLGYASYRLGAGQAAATDSELTAPFAFANDAYRAEVQPDGTFSALRTLPDGRELLAAGERGNRLAACDTTGLGSTHEGVDDVSGRRIRREPAPRGPELAWEPAMPTRLRQTALGATLTATGRLGPRVQAQVVIRLYHALPWLAIDWEFTFDDASLGSFFDDTSKLRVQWPLAAAEPIRHDLAFGHTPSFAARPFFPASWVDVGDARGGLAYFHQGTPKHWVTDGVLNNLLAWGEHTDAIGNRLDMGRWPKSFDQRLRGTHTFHMAVYPHTGDWQTADVIGAARSSNNPLAAFAITGAGALPAAHTALALDSDEVAATAVLVEDEQITCRCYSTGTAAPVAPTLNGLRAAGLFALSGEPLAALAPFQIGALRLTTESQAATTPGGDHP